MTCPRCGGTAFSDRDCGPDGYEDDITYTSEVCDGCGLWHDGWRDVWLLECETCGDEEDAEEFSVPPEYGTPIDVGGILAVQVAKPRTISDDLSQFGELRYVDAGADNEERQARRSEAMRMLRPYFGSVIPVTPRIAAEVQADNEQRDAAVADALGRILGVEED